MPKSWNPNLQWDMESCIAGVYRKSGYIHGIKEVEAKSLDAFVGVQKEIQLLCANTESFLVQSLGVNVLLWGARGSGKSSLVKALLLRYAAKGLRLLQVDKEDLEILPEVFDALREKPYKFIIFCDDLSFEINENYKGLKSVLEGSLEELPKNIRIYATSNRRHLLPEFNDENEIFGYEGNEDKIALSDRFPLCIGFYAQGSKEYLEVLKGYFNAEQLPKNWERICQKATQYATQKGSRNPRTAAHFYALYQSNLWELL
ncbi:ATP-binding protein [Helicobacter sp.]|uniref:ATP-binding protein n=1 Tax=Helicobacter sp. TaxID=218 RepID=UPI0025C047E3|nr:ATP-binding protein [Helicobacter sp.]MCI5969498.1 ATP-binding protein [Helicobacter sp.]MDY2584181.1 ATP-binding protein [Helicobacter sp.]